MSCEHATAHVPDAYVDWFGSTRAKRALASHRGYDFGAMHVAESMAEHFGAPLFRGQVTRLLIDLNRSEWNETLWSRFVSTELSARTVLLERYHKPYREALLQTITDCVEGGQRVLHLAIHSFTPVFHGEKRNADLGLLYDPARSYERLLCGKWAKSLNVVDPPLRVRRNYPYKGTADGVPTWLRREFPVRSYVGIEVEFNQALLRSVKASDERRSSWIRALETALSEG